MRKEMKSLLKFTLPFAFALLLVFSECGEFKAVAEGSFQSDEDKMALVIRDANSYIAENYLIADYYPAHITVGEKIYRPSAQVYDKYGIIGYWDGSALSKINPSPGDKVIGKSNDGPNVPGEKIYRYICFDKWGKRLPNPDFPADAMERNPEGVEIVKWHDMSNPVWERIASSEEMKKSKKLIMDNFRKSLLNYQKEEIRRYFQYRNPAAAGKKEYYKNWENYYLKHFGNKRSEKELSQKINITMLPAKNSSGMAVFKKSNGYYTAFTLEYQEEADATLRILHVVLDGDAPDYVVSPDFHSINGYSENKRLMSGEKIEIKAKNSEAYDVIGHKFFENRDGKFSPPEKGSKAGSIVNLPQFSYIYNYDFNFDKPYLVFYYKRNVSTEKEPRTGRIVVSGKDYEVTKAVPTGENVKIESFSDDANLCDIRWGHNRESIDIRVIVNGISYGGKENYGAYNFEKDIEYHKIDYASLHKLSRIDVTNEKLQKLIPIIQYAPYTPPAELRRYSENILGLRLSKNVITVDGCDFSLNAGRFTKRELDIVDENDNGSEDKERFLAVVVSPLIKNGKKDKDKGEGGIYISESTMSSVVSEVSESVSVLVRNDYLNIAGIRISDDGIFENTAPEPADIPKRPVVLTLPAHHIKNEIRNGNGLTKGVMIYERETVSDPCPEYFNYDISGNNVFIHTPSVNVSEMEDKSKFDQRSEAEKLRNLSEYGDNERLTVPLDNPVKLEIISKGTHISEKGYGSREYRDHIKAKLLKIPFDAYISKDKAELSGYMAPDALFYPAGSIVSFSPKTDTVYFKAAPWVVEKPYQIKTYAIANNADDIIKPSDYANLDFNYDAASQVIDIIVVGRLFDFSLEKVYDPAFYGENPAEFWSVGNKNKDGMARRRFTGTNKKFAEKWTLPLNSAKSPYRNTVKTDIKLGYPIVFSVKSMGTFFTEDDVIVAKPEFYHIDEAGNINKNIHLFYREGGKLINIASSTAGLKTYINYKDLAGKSGQRDMAGTSAVIKYRKSTLGTEVLDGVKFDAMPDFGKYKSAVSRPVLAGTPAYSIMTYPLRIFIGETNSLPHGVEEYRSGMAVQKWTGIYTLPESTVIFRDSGEGRADLNARITEGRLGLIFKIGVARGKNEEGSELEYLTTTYNGYEVEGYLASPLYPEGTICIYSVDKTIEDDKMLN